MVEKGEGEVLRNHHGNNPKLGEAYVSAVSPTIAGLSAKLEALELHSLIPSSDDNGKTGKVIQNSSSNSFRSDNDLKAFIKNVIQQELNDGEKVNYSNNYRKTRYSRRNDDFNGYYNNHLLNPSGNNNGYPYRNVNFDKYGKPGNYYRNNYNNYNGNSYKNDYKPYDRYNNGQSSDYNNSNYTGYNGQSSNYNNPNHTGYNGHINNHNNSNHADYNGQNSNSHFNPTNNQYNKGNTFNRKESNNSKN
jgi:hypothetical protein